MLLQWAPISGGVSGSRRGRCCWVRPVSCREKQIPLGSRTCAAMPRPTLRAARVIPAERPTSRSLNRQRLFFFRTTKLFLEYLERPYLHLSPGKTKTKEKKKRWSNGRLKTSWRAIKEMCANRLKRLRESGLYLGLGN